MHPCSTLAAAPCSSKQHTLMLLISLVRHASSQAAVTLFHAALVVGHSYNKPPAKRLIRIFLAVKELCTRIGACISARTAFTRLGGGDMYVTGKCAHCN